MSMIKEITPTECFKQIARQMDESLEDIIQNDEPTVEGKLRDMAVDDDAAFEFMEQFDTCKEWMTAGYTINFVKSHQDTVVTDKLACALPVVFDPPFEMEGPMQQKQQQRQQQVAHVENNEKAELYTFDEVMGKISAEGRSKLEKENLLLEVVLARVTNQDIAELELPPADVVILRQVIIQCRYHEHTRGGADALIRSVKSHSLYQRFPFEASATFAAMHESGIKSANELYLYTSISRIHHMFDAFQINEQDQRAIMAGIGLAQYARNIAKQNKKHRLRK